MKKLVLISLLVIPFCKAADVGGKVSKISVFGFVNLGDDENGSDTRLYNLHSALEVDLVKETIQNLIEKIRDLSRCYSDFESEENLSIDSFKFKSDSLAGEIDLLTKDSGDTLHAVGIRNETSISVLLKRACSENIKG